MNEKRNIILQNGLIIRWLEVSSLSDTKTFTICIPLDEDGYLEMECDFCKNRFMLHKNIYEDTKYLHFFCPICGLPNETDTFFCTEVLEKMQRVATNYALAQIDAILGKSFKELNKNKFIKVTTKKSKIEPENELYEPTKAYELIKMDCCNIYLKTQNFDKEIGIYCPICGGTKI